MSAAGSAAQLARADEYENHSGALINKTDLEDNPVRGHPKIQLVSEELPGRREDYLESNSLEPKIEVRREARIDDVGLRASFISAVEKASDETKTPVRSGKTTKRTKGGLKSTEKNEFRAHSLKKLNKKQIAEDWPPAPRGCEWRRSDNGLNLWRCWTDWNDDQSKKIKKSRYAGHLSDDAWRIMKEYDYEAFISIIGERLRRHGGR